MHFRPITPIKHPKIHLTRTNAYRFVHRVEEHVIETDEYPQQNNLFISEKSVIKVLSEEFCKKNELEKYPNPFQAYGIDTYLFYHYYGFMIILSSGPNLEFDNLNLLNNYDRSKNETKEFIEYDPTNGTKSQGDVFIIRKY